MIKSLDKESRLALLRQASPEVQELYGGEENGQVISALAAQLNIASDAAYDTFALTIGDIILGSYSKDVLGQLLKDRMGFTDQEIIITENGLRDFLNKIPRTESTQKDPMVFVPEPDTFTSDTAPLANENPQGNGRLAADLKPLRTFAMDVDMSRVHGYGAFKSGEADGDDDTPVHHSNQDDIIKK